MHPTRKPSHKEVRVVSAKGCHLLPNQEQGNAGIAGHRAFVTAMGVPRFGQAIKNPGGKRRTPGSGAVCFLAAMPVKELSSDLF